MKEKNLSTFSNGYFDIIHSRHVDYLKGIRFSRYIYTCKLDISITIPKGKKTYNKINERLSILKSWEFVDAIIVFEENTPIPIVKTGQT